MVTTVSRSAPPQTAWQQLFLSMLPAIRTHARLCFRHLNREERDEAVQAAVCNACAAVARLAELGKLDLAYPTVLASYAVRQIREGRNVGSKLNCRDVASRYCQQRKGVSVERLDKYDREEDCWLEAVVQDTRTSPVPEIVAFRCDFREWLCSLKRRDRRLAEHLSLGNGTLSTARKFDLSPARVSQLRRELAMSWKSFVHEDPGDAAAVPA